MKETNKIAIVLPIHRIEILKQGKIINGV